MTKSMSPSSSISLIDAPEGNVSKTTEVLASDEVEL